MNDDKEKNFEISIQHIQKYLKLIEINKESTKISTEHYINQLDKNIIAFYKSKLQLIEISHIINNKDDDIIYKRTLSSNPESIFNEDLLIHIKSILTFLHSHPIFFADILKRSRTQLQIKSIINHLQINYVNSIFSVNEMSKELFIIIAILIHNDISLLKNKLDNFLLNDSLLQEIFLSLFNLEQIQIFLYSIINPTLKEIIKYKNNILFFKSADLQLAVKQTKTNKINNIVNYHEESLNEIHEILDESDSYLKSIRECYYLTPNINISKPENRELIKFTSGISVKHLKECYKECNNDVTKEILEGFMDDTKINSISFANIIFNNSVNILKDEKEIKNLQKQNGNIVVDIIESFLYALTNNLDKMPSILKQLCLLIKEVALICIPNIKELQIYTLISKFLFQNFVLFALNNPNHKYFFNNEMNNSNSLHNIQIINYVLQKLFDLSLFHALNDPQYTFLNSYFVNMIPKIVNIYNKILTCNEQLYLPQQLIKEIIVKYNSNDIESKFQKCELNNNEIVLNESIVVSTEGLLWILKLLLSTKAELKNIYDNKLKNNEINLLLESINYIEESITYLQIQYENSLISKTFEYFLFKKIDYNKLTINNQKNLNLSNINGKNSGFSEIFIQLFPVIQSIPFQIHSQNINDLINQIENYKFHYEGNINKILFELKKSSIDMKEQEIQTILNEFESELNTQQINSKNNFENDLILLHEKLTLSQLKLKAVVKMIHIYENIYCDRIVKSLTEQENIIVKFKVKKEKNIVKVFLKEIDTKKFKANKNIVKSIKQFCDHFMKNIDISSYYSKSKITNHYEQYSKASFPIILNDYLKMIFTKTNPKSLKLLNQITHTDNDKTRLLNLINRKIEEYVFIRMYDKLYKKPIQDGEQFENVNLNVKTLDIKDCILGLNEMQYLLIKKLSVVFNKILLLKSPKSIINLIRFVNEYIEERIKNINITNVLFYYIINIGFNKIDSLLQYLEIFLFDSDKYKKIIDILIKIKEVLLNNDINKFDDVKTKKNFDLTLRSVISSK